VDKDYIVRAILDPLAEHPENMQPLMPKMPLTKIELEYLVRFVMEHDGE
jgi:hypothetical protein